jgi:cell division protein FtsB
MSPQAAASRPLGRHPSRRAERIERNEQRRELRLVERPARRRRRVARKLAATLVLVSLVTVVVGHALLAQEQVRLSVAENQLTTEQSAHRQDVLALAQRETPERVVSQAEALHLVTPGRIVQVPYVPLDVPLATPTVAPASATTPTTASTTASTPTTSTGSSGG